ncbi:PadR family transcriptional regulator [Pseudarthrobacter sp. J1738]|uniref:PadR family transcriptional regulator n=1 Tax=Pseudarthrobacter sp. J1738 TaxID=3420446 RepID=UPI003D2D92EC
MRKHHHKKHHEFHEMAHAMHHHDGEHGHRDEAGFPESEERPNHGRGGRFGGPGFGGKGFGGPGPFGGQGFAGPGFAGPGFGGPGPFGGRSPFGPGGRVRKGNVRNAILSLLSQSPENGYGLIKSIAAHTDGAWRPSPGSVYPALSALQAEGLIESVGEGRRTEFALTEDGKAHTVEHASELAAVWEEVNQEAGVGQDLKLSIGKLMGAVHQIGIDGTEEKLQATIEALDEARRTIYKLLAD